MYIDKELESLNYEKVKQNIGGIFFVSIAMVIGITGNLHVLCVYSFRMKQSNPRIFILFLAALDFITCAVGMPFIIIDLTNPLTFYAVTACKVLRFVNYFICLSSAFILLIIAIDRYVFLIIILYLFFSSFLMQLHLHQYHGPWPIIRC